MGFVLAGLASAGIMIILYVILAIDRLRSQNHSAGRGWHLREIHAACTSSAWLRASCGRLQRCCSTRLALLPFSWWAYIWGCRSRPWWSCGGSGRTAAAYLVGGAFCFHVQIRPDCRYPTSVWYGFPLLLIAISWRLHHGRDSPGVAPRRPLHCLSDREVSILLGGDRDGDETVRG
jgi:hypothetical protein